MGKEPLLDSNTAELTLDKKDHHNPADTELDEIKNEFKLHSSHNKFILTKIS
jgi:hypothetical protein